MISRRRCLFSRQIQSFLRVCNFIIIFLLLILQKYFIMDSKTIFMIIGLFAFVNCQTISSTTREPSLQAYGLPKRFLSNNGYIEKINIDNKKIISHRGDPTGSKKNSTTKAKNGIDGALEILHLDDSITKNSRDRRSIDNEKSLNNDDDLHGEESKVFRPLFVYRQQVAKRQKNQRERNQSKSTKPRYPIYYNKNSLHYNPHSS